MADAPPCRGTSPRRPATASTGSGGLPFLAVHAACLAVVWTGVSPVAIAIGALTLLTRMFGLTAGYHRYFCHRTFRTTRTFQFVLAWLGASAAQMGPLWWAGHHRSHHRHSDTGDDVHSPSAQGFLTAHFGWILSRGNQRTKTEWVPDLLRFPELRWLDRNHYLAPLALGTALFAAGEWLGAVRPGLGTHGRAARRRRPVLEHDGPLSPHLRRQFIGASLRASALRHR